MSIYVRDADGNRQKIAGVGLPGPAGKSAYQYAVEGGFSGTEEEFRALMGVHSNDNLLDNANFRYPINQRGQTEYIGFGYTIDRWNTEGTTIKILSDGIQLENTSDTVASQFVSTFEASRLINGQIYTASLLAKDLIGSGTMVIQYREGAFTYLLSAPLSDGLISVSGNLSTSGINLLGYMIVLHPNSSVKFIAAKLELGPVQTLAHKEGDNWVLNDPPPNKALELAKCQQYQVFGPLYGVKVWEHVGGWCGFYIPTPVILKRAPTLIGKIQYRVGGNVEDIDYANNIPGFNLLQNGCYTYMHVPDNTNMIIIPQGSGLDSNL